MTTARSFCTGYTGLEMAVRAAFGDFTVLSHSDIKPAANVLLAHHYPDIPNLGDMRAIDYTALDRADLMIGSWPCQPHSSAGKRLGEADPRDLWPEYLRAITVHRPAMFFGENVARITSNGELRRVVTSLAELGYVVAWVVRAAADVGACHLRKRCFVVAVDGSVGATADPLGDLLRHEPGRGSRASREGAGIAGHDGPQRSVQRLSLLPTPTPTQSMTKGAGTSGRDGGLNLQTAVACLPTPSVADSRNTRNATARRSEGQEHHHSGWTLCDVAHADTWGKYGPAIARHEQALGRPAPEPTAGTTKAGNPLLNPAFVNWMMMLPEGHVTGVPGLTRSQQLSLLGDGVVPAQGAAAFAFLLNHLARRFASERAA
ncbi:MAG TPA: DNA cytosine methyltransferase [Pseudonocardia sp.]